MGRIDRTTRLPLYGFGPNVNEAREEARSFAKPTAFLGFVWAVLLSSGEAPVLVLVIDAVKAVGRASRNTSHHLIFIFEKGSQRLTRGQPDILILYKRSACPRPASGLEYRHDLSR